MTEDFKSVKFALRHINNGFIVNSPDGETYFKTETEAIRDLRLVIDAVEKEITPKTSVPGTSKPQQPVGVR